MKTLEEVKKIVGLERRAIQEYEKAGLAEKPKNRNKYGHLLYSDKEIERLWQLRFYKELGYNIPKVKSICENKPYFDELELEKIIIELKQKRDMLNNMINIAEMMKETGLEFNQIKNSMADINILKSDDMFAFLGAIHKVYGSFEWENVIDKEVLSDEKLDSIFDLFDMILECKNRGIEPNEKEAQEYVRKMDLEGEQDFSVMVLFCNIFLPYICSGNRMSEELEKDMGKENVEYIYNAIQYYCTTDVSNGMDKIFTQILDNIANLGVKRYKTYSMEVQIEVEKIHTLFKKVKIYKEDEVIKILRLMSDFFREDVMIRIIDNGNPRGIAWFIARAIEIYCEKIGGLECE